MFIPTQSENSSWWVFANDNYASCICDTKQYYVRTYSMLSLNMGDIGYPRNILSDASSEALEYPKFVILIMLYYETE